MQINCEPDITNVTFYHMVYMKIERNLINEKFDWIYYVFFMKWLIFSSKGTVYFVLPNLDTYFFKVFRSVSLFATTIWQVHPFQQEILDLLWLILYGYFKPNLFFKFPHSASS